MNDYIGSDPRLQGLRIECSDPIPDVWSHFTIRESNGMVIADNLTGHQVTLLINRMRTVQVLP